MLYLLVSIPLLCSLLGVYYYILTKDKSEKEVRFIPLVFLFIIFETLPFILMPDYLSVGGLKIVVKFISFFWILAFLLLFLYKLMEKRKLSKASIFSLIIPTFLLSVVLIVYLIQRPMINYTEKKWLMYSYFAGVLMVTIFFIVLSYKRTNIQKKRYPHQKLIQLLSIQIEVAWIFFIVWFVVNYRSGDLFTEPMYIFFNLMEVSVSLSLYWYLFELYKNKLRQEKIIRLKDFASVPELPVMVASSSMQDESQVNGMFDIHVNSYRKSALSAKKLDVYKKKVEDFFLENKGAYLDPDFNMEFLSSQTGISRYHLSQVFNLGFHSSFPAHVNEKRINYACELIKEYHGSLTVSELMNRCGIRSRASFYYYFKKVVGCMPGEYLYF